MALKLVLKPGEKIAINGAVVVNGDRRTSFAIENEARILREADIIQHEDATTPAARIYLPIMMMYLTPESTDKMQTEYEKRLAEFVQVISDADALSTCARINAHIASNAYYKAMTECRALMEFEKTRLSDVA